MDEMTLYTRTTLIDAIGAALSTREPNQIDSAQRLLRMKCHQHKVSWLVFLFEEALPVIKPQTTAMAPGSFLQLDRMSYKCPYCSNKVFGSEMGLKAHLGRKHHDKKSDWSIKIQ